MSMLMFTRCQPPLNQASKESLKSLLKSIYAVPFKRQFTVNNTIYYDNFAKVPLAPLRYALRSPPRERFRFFHSFGGVSVVCRQHILSRVQQKAYRPNNLVRNYSVLSDFSAKMTERKEFERLPSTVKPKHYVLSIVPDLKSLTFQGKVSIQIEVVKSTDEIVLNAVDLNISNVSLQGNEAGLQKPETELLPKDEIAKFKFKNPLSVGSYDLDIAFTGDINDKMKGLYRSKYESENGEERYAAVTQFESTDARRCFPCWDEPALKATFDITLTVPKKLVALSNMPVKTSKETGDLMVYNFETTPIMSTYLVAAVIGEYDYIEDRSSDGVLVRVYTPKGKTEQGKFALEVATKCLPYYKDYFNIAYPLPKMDLIAIADFSAGAMENWGLVTYRETCLLVDPENTSTMRKQWVAIVVGHELAHQWFGNLVTMEWWTHLWLNEGYAQFTEYLCVDHIFPHFDIWKQFVSETHIRALELDGLENSHPIEVPVGHPSEIDEIFDDISYSKGASVIRMLHNYLGEADFRKGMYLYLTKHQYKNTFTEDLWAALEEASKKPVGDVMSTWTKQKGFPVVRVTTKPSKDEKGIVATLSQSKFTADGSKPDGDYMWWVPIAITTSKSDGKEVVQTVLKDQSTDVLIPGIGPDDWIKLNPGTIGYYRTQYEPEMLDKLMPAVRDQSLPPLDRLGLLDDLFALVQAGKTTTVEMLKLLSAFEDENDYTVWSIISNILGKVSVLISNTEFEEAFKVYQKKLLSKVSQRLGWDLKPKESHMDTLLRSLVLSRLAVLDDETTVKEARTRFQNHIGPGPVLPADLRGPCYRAVLRAGGQEEYDSLIKLYRSVDLQEEKDRIGRSLGGTKNVELLKKVCEFAISDEVRSQDTVSIIMALGVSRVGRELAWDFYKSNWSIFCERYDGGYLLARLVKSITENFAHEKTAQEVEAFFKEHHAPGTERAVQQAVETIRLNSVWLQRDISAIKKFFA